MGIDAKGRPNRKWNTGVSWFDYIFWILILISMIFITIGLILHNIQTM